MRSHMTKVLGMVKLVRKKYIVSCKVQTTVNVDATSVKKIVDIGNNRSALVAGTHMIRGDESKVPNGPLKRVY
jgi:hypothetical protein